MGQELDDKDWKILEILKEHGDYTTRELAKKTLLPPTTIHNRIKRLKQEKIIKKFTVELDNSRIGKSFLAYVLISANLALLKQKKKTQYDLAEEIKRFDFVERVDIIAGERDLITLIRVKDASEFDKVLFGRLQVLEGIDKTQSLIVLHAC